MRNLLELQGKYSRETSQNMIKYFVRFRDIICNRLS